MCTAPQSWHAKEIAQFAGFSSYHCKNFASNNEPEYAIFTRKTAHLSVVQSKAQNRRQGSFLLCEEL